MTTTLTVGSGKTYSTITAAYNAIPSPFIDDYKIEIYEGTYDESTIGFEKNPAGYSLTFEAPDGESVTWGNGSTAFEIRQDFTATTTYFNNIRFSYYAVKNNQSDASSFTHTINFNRCFFENRGVTRQNFNGVLHIIFKNCISERVLVEGLGAPSSGTHTLEVYNSTLTSPSDGGMLVTAETGSIILKNNVFYSSLSSGLVGMLIAPDTDPANIICENNIYYWENGSVVFRYNGLTGRTLAQWSTDTGSNATEQDPSLVDYANGNYYPAQGSPCINNGVTTGLTEDYNGNTRPLDGAYDIGAYEFDILLVPLSGNFRIGVTNDNVPYVMKGHIDEFRVSKGVARFTTAFTPPIKAYDNRNPAVPL